MIYEVEPDDWRELVTEPDLFPGFVFRGQISYSWELSTTLERLAIDSSGRLVELEGREFWILTQFRRRAHNFIEKPPRYDELVEWLSLIQHHGGPTRLLDFTHSPFVGLFFACDGAKEDAALWMIDYHDLLDSHVVQGSRETIYHQQRAILQSTGELIGKSSSQAKLIPIQPERMSERMSIQQGLSILPGDINRTFMENLGAHYGWQPVHRKTVTFSEFSRDLYGGDMKVAKISLKADWFPDILKFLDYANVNANTLFPGLDGFARSLSIYIAGYPGQ